MLEIDLAPTQGAKFLRPEPMPVHKQDRRTIPQTIPSSLPGSLDQALNLRFG
jgi:hypothetical protein